MVNFGEYFKSELKFYNSIQHRTVLKIFPLIIIIIIIHLLIKHRQDNLHSVNLHSSEAYCITGGRECSFLQVTTHYFIRDHSYHRFKNKNKSIGKIYTSVHMIGYDEWYTIQHWTVQIIFPLILQTIITARMYNWRTFFSAGNKLTYHYFITDFSYHRFNKNGISKIKRKKTEKYNTLFAGT